MTTWPLEYFTLPAFFVPLCHGSLNLYNLIYLLKLGTQWTAFSAWIYQAIGRNSYPECWFLKRIMWVEVLGMKCNDSLQTFDVNERHGNYAEELSFWISKSSVSIGDLWTNMDMYPNSGGSRNTSAIYFLFEVCGITPSKLLRTMGFPFTNRVRICVVLTKVVCHSGGRRQLRGMMATLRTLPRFWILIA